MLYSNSIMLQQTEVVKIQEFFKIEDWFIAYWIKMSGYSQTLSEGGRYQSNDAYDRDDRDRPWDRKDNPDDDYR